MDQTEFRKFTSKIGPEIQLLVENWFGKPADLEAPIKYYRASGSSFLRSIFPRMYFLIVDEDYNSEEQIIASIGHSMYRRVTIGKKGLRQQLWVDQMLAYKASQWVVEEMCPDYAAYYKEWHLDLLPVMQIDQLKTAKRTKFLRAVKSGVHYPEEFGAGVAVIADKLETCVGQIAVADIVNHRTWDTWLATLSVEARSGAVSILALQDKIEGT